MMKRQKKAEQYFTSAFSKGEAPEDIKDIKALHGTMMKDILIKEGIVTSNSDWRRLVEGNAVSNIGTDEVITDPYAKVEKNMTLRIGKKRFAKITIK